MVRKQQPQPESTMHRCILILISVLLFGIAAADTTAFFNINVIPMVDERIIRQQTVIVSDGVIASVGLPPLSRISGWARRATSMKE